MTDQMFQEDPILNDESTKLHLKNSLSDITSNKVQDTTDLISSDLSGSDFSYVATVEKLYKPVYTVNPREHSTQIEFIDDSQIQITYSEETSSKFRKYFSEVLWLGRDLFFAVVVLVLIVFFIVQPVKVEGTSMLPRLHDGERIFINKFIYNFNPIKRGDIVVFWYPKDPNKSFIKRVIGLPGDEIQIYAGKLRINGKLMEETYLSKDYTTLTFPNHTWVVEPHHYFVMGDNRDASNDSRNWGLVPEKYIYGQAMYRYWPPQEAGLISSVDAQVLNLSK